MSLPNIESTFSVSVKGDTTGHMYLGPFTVRAILTKREEFLADIRRRELVGPLPEDALPTIRNNAYALSQLYARVVDAPAWWRESDSGANLHDTNVIAEVFAKSLEAAEEWRKKVSGEAAKAEPVVKKAAKRAPKDEEDEADAG